MQTVSPGHQMGDPLQQNKALELTVFSHLCNKCENNQGITYPQDR